MELEAIKALLTYVSVPVELAIYEKEVRDISWMAQRIRRVKPCPDCTHLRLYFDDFHFLAVPFNSVVSFTKDTWTTFDADSLLYYGIRKERLL